MSAVGLRGPANLVAGNFILIPSLSEKKRKRAEDIKKAQEGVCRQLRLFPIYLHFILQGRKKRARLLDEQLLHEGIWVPVQNQDGT